MKSIIATLSILIISVTSMASNLSMTEAKNSLKHAFEHTMQSQCKVWQVDSETSAQKYMVICEDENVLSTIEVRMLNNVITGQGDMSSYAGYDNNYCSFSGKLTKSGRTLLSKKCMNQK